MHRNVQALRTLFCTLRTLALRLHLGAQGATLRTTLCAEHFPQSILYEVGRIFRHADLGWVRVCRLSCHVIARACPPRAYLAVSPVCLMGSPGARDSTVVSALVHAIGTGMLVKSCQFSLVVRPVCLRENPAAPRSPRYDMREMV